MHEILPFAPTRPAHVFVVVRSLADDALALRPGPLRRLLTAGTSFARGVIPSGEEGPVKSEEDEEQRGKAH